MMQQTPSEKEPGHPRHYDADATSHPVTHDESERLRIEWKIVWKVYAVSDGPVRRRGSLPSV